MKKINHLLPDRISHYSAFMRLERVIWYPFEWLKCNERLVIPLACQNKVLENCLLKDKISTCHKAMHFVDISR